MTKKVQKIREEVVRLKSQLLRGACSSQVAMETRCKEEAYNEVLAILDTMQEEPKSKFEQSIREGDNIIYNEDLGCRVNLSQLDRVAKKEESVSEDNNLRKASEEYLKVLSETPYNNTPITNAQTIVRELITFLDNPSKYNPNHIEEPVSEDWEKAAEMFIDSFIPTEVNTVTPFAAEYVIELLNKAIEFGANWQKNLNKKDFELLKEWFEDISEKCEHLTSGNVSHNGKMIRGFARNCAEYIKIDLL